MCLVRQSAVSESNDIDWYFICSGKNMNTSNRVDNLQRVFNFQERPLKYAINLINNIPPKSSSTLSSTPENPWSIGGSTNLELKSSACKSNI